MRVHRSNGGARAERPPFGMESLTLLVGFVAGLGTTFAAMPDLFAMLRRRSHCGLRPRMAAITGSFQIVWIYYGLLIGSMPLVMWNAVGVSTNFLTVGAYLYFRHRERIALTAAPRVAVSGFDAGTTGDTGGTEGARGTHRRGR